MAPPRATLCQVDNWEQLVPAARDLPFAISVRKSSKDFSSAQMDVVGVSFCSGTFSLSFFLSSFFGSSFFLSSFVLSSFVLSSIFWSSFFDFFLSFFIFSFGGQALRQGLLWGWKSGRLDRGTHLHFFYQMCLNIPDHTIWFIT